MDLKTRIAIFAYLRNLKAPIQTHFLKHYRTAWARYLGAQEYVALAEEAARQVSRKYDLGAATVTDYNAAVTTRVKARSQLLQAKYEYLFKIKTLTYYTLYYGE